jgi:hypothetical protein
MLYNEEGLVFEILARRGIERKLIANNIHTLTVLKEMDVVVTCGGTIGQEFSYMKKPVVLAATPPYAGYGFTTEPKSIEDYEHLLRNDIQNLERLNEIQFNKLKKVLFYDFVLQNNYTEDLEIGGQRFYIGRKFNYEMFYERIIQENKISYNEQLFFKKINTFIVNRHKHILNHR